MTAPKLEDSKFSLFIPRACPFCSSTDAELLVEMKVSLLLKSNPGYIIDWFADQKHLMAAQIPYKKCRKCRFVFVGQRLEDDMLARYYNEGVDAAKSREKILTHRRRIWLIKMWQTLHACAPAERLRVLDFGAGWGDFLMVSKTAGVEAYGLEFDRRKIHFALENHVPLGDFDFVREHMPYDIFFCNQVLEHLNDPKAALLQMRSLLKSGAAGYISVPSYPDTKINDEIAAINAGTLPTKDFDPLGHLNYFSPESLRSMVEDAGFRPFSPAKVQSAEQVGIWFPKLFFKSLRSRFTSERKGVAACYVTAI